MSHCLFQGIVRDEKFAPSPHKVDIVKGKIIDIHIHGISGFTLKQKDFLLKAMRLKLDILHSVEFRDAVLKKEVRDTNGLTPKNVYRLLMSGKSASNEVADADIDIFITAYHSDKDVVGYSYLTGIKMWHNTRYLKNWMTRKDGHAHLAGHLFHEYLHLCGLTHTMKNGSYSGTLVYEWGYIMRNIGIDVILKKKSLTVIKDVDNLIDD